MKNHHVFIILCTVCLIAAFSAGCTSPSTPATPVKTTTTVSTAAPTPVSTTAATPVPTAVVTKPATPVPQVASANGSYTLNESDNKFYYSVPKNSQVYVVLDENPTTGWSWNLTTTPGLTIVKDEFYPPSTSQGFGSSGMHEWELKAVTSGEQKISGVLKHVSDPITGKETTYTVFLSVD
ncbi:MAG: protease inhibitor I42 family protein [Methanoregula sp.]